MGQLIGSLGRSTPDSLTVKQRCRGHIHRIVSALLVAGLILVVPNMRAAQAGAATTVETNAVNWAVGQIGSTAWPGDCLPFVQKAYYHTGMGINTMTLTNYQDYNTSTDPEDIWDAGFNAGTTGTTSSPPYGALVFFNSKTPTMYSPEKYSHVTIMGTGGEMISTNDFITNSKVHEETIAQAETSLAYATYVGWWLPDGKGGGGIGSIGNGVRFTNGSTPQQYIDWYGASLPLSVGDAEAYNDEGNNEVVTDNTHFLTSHPASDLPHNTVVRIVGTPSQYLYTGSGLDPITDSATSSCLLYAYGQTAPAVVPTMWSDTIPVGPGVPCSLPNGTRFTQQGSLAQYISWYGASLPLSYADALAYTAEGNKTSAVMAPGYLTGHPASNLPHDTVVRIVGTPSQYLYTGSVLDPITSPPTSSCLLYSYGQTVPAVVPTMWADTIPVGPGVPCSLPNGTRFTQQGSLAQYISWYGASLPLSYADALAYTAEGNKTSAVMAPGYLTGHPASNLPHDTVVRIVGTPSQYLYTGSALDPIGTPATSSCLLSTYGQVALAVVPTMWADTIPVGPATSCPSNISMNSPGYDLVGSDGGVFVFPTGQSGGFFGSLPGLGVKVNNIVGMVPTTTDHGYFLVGSDGGVFAFGTAPFLGSLPGLHVTPAQPITGIVAANTDKGYFLVGRDGGVFAFGTVPFLGSLPGRGIHANNIIGIASTPSGNGYWLVSATGTVYGFGAAQGLGTTKGTPSPVSAIAGTPTGGGYWITTQNGTVYPFGNAKSFGTLPALRVTPAHPVIGIVHTADTGGYWLIGSDGGIFAFGDAGFVGSLPGVTVHVTDVVGAVPT